MPTYEFACPRGHRFDKFFRKISESTPTLPCPECGLEAARQLSAGAGLIFRGSGFYITDYGKDGKKAPAAPAEGGEKAGRKEKGTATDSAASGGTKAPDAAKPASEGSAGSKSSGSGSE